MTNTIFMEGVELTYSDGTETVNGIDLEISDGEFFGFLGPNGQVKDLMWPRLHTAAVCRSRLLWCTVVLWSVS